MSGAPPRQRLRHWLCLSCYRRPASADFWPCPASARTARRLRRQLRSRLRRLPQPRLARCARLHKGRSGVNAPLRCAFNITASYAKSGQSLRRLRLVSRPLRALRVRVSAVMSCAPTRPTASFGASRRFIQRCATGGLRPTVGLRLRACRRARYGRRRRQSVGGGTVPPAPTFDSGRYPLASTKANGPAGPLLVSYRSRYRSAAFKLLPALNFAPTLPAFDALKRGTRAAGIRIDAPVRGLRPVRAARRPT